MHRGHIADADARTNQDGLYQPQLPRFNRSTQRDFVTWVRDSSDNWRQLLRRIDQP
jgi:hypothetical protein